eukprot:COSAG02_NODE_681_length_18539_cov_44.668925_8_plen_101_part_00
MVATASVFAPVFEQWPTPGVLSRSWCLFEFYHAIKLGKPFEPAVVASASNAIDAGFSKTDGGEDDDIPNICRRTLSIGYLANRGSAHELPQLLAVVTMIH